MTILFMFSYAFRFEGCYSRPNILILLADDLGYGDLSLPPFLGSGIKTPEIEKMATMSTVMTNFHVAAPICTPTRASILTGLFPWRLGIRAIYGTGLQANDVLHVVPNLPMTLLTAGYHTAHVGKWHLGGITPSDIDKRRISKPLCEGTRPGPNQHGFLEYVSMMEGPGSPRLTKLLPQQNLYREGAKYLIRNDTAYSPLSLKQNEILTDRQVFNHISHLFTTLLHIQPFGLCNRPRRRFVS